MSEQLTAASQAMNVPEPIVERSARARAEATGSTYEEILTAWAGGEAVAAAPAPAEPAAEPAPAAEEEAAAPEAASEPAAPATPEVPAQPIAAFQEVEPEEEEEIEPLPLRTRVGLAGKVGAWTGALLGLLGLVFGSTWLLGAASVAGEEGAYGPAVEVTTSRLLLGVVALSVLFGLIVATFSRAAAGWLRPGARLQGRWIPTVAVGAGLGLVLGLGAGGVMISAFAEPIEGAEGMALMRIVPALFVVTLGGALLGWLTAVLVQVVGVPVGVEGADAEEVTEIRSRLSGAFRIPLTAVLLLAVLVLPLGVVFIRSNELTSGGAAVLAIFAAASILGIASMSASRPTMRVSLGEVLVAAAGVATVVLIIFAVIQTQAGPSEGAEQEEAATEEEADVTETTASEEGATTEPEARAGGSPELVLFLS